MGNKFKNNNRSTEEEIIGGCGNSHPEADIPLTEEDLRILKSEAIHAKQRLNAYTRSKNSRTNLTPPYITHPPEDLIYIPLVFHQFISTESHSSFNVTSLMDTDSTYTNTFYTEVVDYLNSFMDGTHVPSGTIGAHRDHPDHGVESKIRFKIATHLPSTFVSKFLNINASHYSGEQTLKGIASFNFTNASIENAKAAALSVYTTAEAAKDLKYQELLNAGNTDEEAISLLKETQEYTNYVQALYINSLEGLIQCGTQGAIFTYDLRRLDPCTLSTLHGESVGNPITSCDETFCFHPEGNCDLPHNSPLGNISGAVSHGGFVSYCEELGLWGNTLPVMNVWTTVGSAMQPVLFRGFGPSPTHSYNGNVYMNDVERFIEPNGDPYQAPESSYRYAQILLHELGHSLGLPHTFQGGSVTDMKDVITPNMNFPLEDHTVELITDTTYSLIPPTSTNLFAPDLNLEVSEDITIGDLFYTSFPETYINAQNETITAIDLSQYTIKYFTIPLDKITGFTNAENLVFVCNASHSRNLSALWDGGSYFLDEANYILESQHDNDKIVIPAGANLSAFQSNSYRVASLSLNSTLLNTGNTLTIDVTVPSQTNSFLKYNLRARLNSGEAEFGVSLYYPYTEVTTFRITTLGGDVDIPLYFDYAFQEGTILLSDVLSPEQLEGIESVSLIVNAPEWRVGVEEFYIQTTYTAEEDVIINPEQHSLSVMSNDEATFLDVFFNKIKDNGQITTKVGLATTTNPDTRSISKEIKEISNPLGADLLNLRRKLFEQFLNLPSFWSGSVDTTQLNSQGNASLVFNKIVENTHVVDLSALEITNDYFSNIVYNESSGQIEMQTSGSQGVNMLLWGVITLSEEDLGEEQPNRTLVIESVSDHNRNVLIKQYFSVGGSISENVLLIAESSTSIELSEVTNQVDILLIEQTLLNEQITVINSISTVTTQGYPLNTRTRVPFCVPNADGTPSDVLDEFWHINFNWLDENYPAYPDNWPTDKAYDEFDDEGNPLCPCLYATQNYTKDGEPFSRDTLAMELSSIGYLNTDYFSFQALKHCWLCDEDEYHLYNTDVPKINLTNSLNVGDNGHMPLFGYYGFTPFQGVPEEFGLNFNPNSVNFYTNDDLLSDTPRVITKGEVSYSEILTRTLLGSSDAADPYYNPFKIDVPIEVVYPSRFAMDLVIVENSPTNPLYGSDTSVGEINVNFMHHAMNYDRESLIFSEEGDFTHETTELFVKRILFSVEGVFRVEAILDSGRGKWHRIKEFSRLTNLEYSYATSPDMQNTLEEITAYVENYTLENQGCTDPAAANYDPNAFLSDGSCMYAGSDDCIFPIETINVCIDTNVLTCNQVEQEILDLFPPGDTVSIIMYSDEYPQAPEGCIGGGFQYSIDTEECIYGELEIVGCAGGETFTTEDIQALGEENYELICPDARYTLTANLYTSGGIYFTASGDSYSGVYCVRSGGIAFSGSLKFSGERLYTKDQLSKVVKVLDSLEDTAKKFVKIQKNIQNICRFVKL